MRTNHAGVTEKAEFNVDKEKYNSGYDHIFNREKCKCEECEKEKILNKSNENEQKK